MRAARSSSVVVVMLALATWACSDSAGPSGNGDDVVTVVVSGLTFSPATRTITRGTTVRWVNGSDVFHTVTPDGHTAWANRDLAAGTQFEHTFNTAGTYAYFCTPHQSVGMTGTIIVQ